MRARLRERQQETTGPERGEGADAIRIDVDVLLDADGKEDREQCLSFFLLLLFFFTQKGARVLPPETRASSTLRFLVCRARAREREATAGRG